MNSDNPKIQTLLSLGEPRHNRDWPDYVKQYGFDDQDIPALLSLYTDETINDLDSKRPEVWAPMHAWRILGQLAAEAAIDPLVLSFDEMFKDDYALGELSRVIGMIGPAAIPALSRYWQQAGKEEFCYVMAMDALGEIAKQHPPSREAVIQIFLDYMTRPMITARFLNGLLIANLLDLKAVETIVRATPKVGRNDPCPCGSGRKYKKCCGLN